MIRRSPITRRARTLLTRGLAGVCLLATLACMGTSQALASAADDAALALLAELLALDAPTVTGTGARVWGEANGSNLVSDSTTRAFASENAEAWAASRQELVTAQYNQGVLVAALAEAGGTLARQTAGAAASLAESLARAVEALGRSLEARDHDPQDTRQDCAGLARDAAAQAGPTAQARWREGVTLALEGLADRNHSDFADARHAAEARLVTGPAMRGREGFSADWLLPSSGLVEGDDLTRQLLMLDALASPVPAAPVPETREDTAGGMAAAAALTRRSALVALARGALVSVAAGTVPLAVYADAVEALHAESGDAGDTLPAEGSFGGEDGYSYLQYLEAARRHFLGATRELALEAGPAVSAWRLVCDVGRHGFDLAARGQRLSLWRSALLAALAGRLNADGAGAGHAASAAMGSPR